MDRDGALGIILAAHGAVGLHRIGRSAANYFYFAATVRACVLCANGELREAPFPGRANPTRFAEDNRLTCLTCHRGGDRLAGCLNGFRSPRLEVSLGPFHSLPVVRAGAGVGGHAEAEHEGQEGTRPDDLRGTE